MRGIRFRRIAGIFILTVVLLVPHLASAQQEITTGSLTVTGFGQASAPADNATVHLTVSSESMMMSPIPISGRSAETEVVPIVDALALAGVDENTIDVITGPSVAGIGSYFGPAIAIIRFDVADPTADSIAGAFDAATDAAEDARLYIGGLSVQTSSTTCATLERDAREAAIADARKRADVLGELAGLLPGETISVRDVSYSPDSAYIYFSPVQSGCSPVAPGNIPPEIYGPTTYDLAQEPTVTVYAQVEMTFATSPSILATPSG